MLPPWSSERSPTALLLGAHTPFGSVGVMVIGAESSTSITQVPLADKL